MSTKDYGGRTLKKNIQVTTNDPARKEFSLTITGQVKAYANITPSRVRFSTKLNEKSSKTVTIFPNKEFPLKILSATPRNNKSGISCSLTSTKGESGMGYMLTVDSINDKPGSFSDTIVLKTDSAVVPEITIPVSGYVMAPPVEKNK